MDPRFGTGMWQTVEPRRLIDIVRLCEELGYAHFWYANEKFYRDLSVGYTLAAEHSKTMTIGPFIAEPYTVHPALVAVMTATVDELSGGRAALLLGAGGHSFDKLGVTRTRPAKALYEALAIARQVFSNQEITYRGEVFSVEGARMKFPVRPTIPIYVATRGDRVLEMAGAHADGVMIATYATPEGVSHALERVEAGARSRGRSLTDLELFSRVDACIWPEREVARNAVRPMVAGMLMASYPDTRFVTNLGLRLPQDLLEIVSTKQLERIPEAARLLPDEFVDQYTWAGSASEVAERIAGVVRAGIRNITILPHPPEGERIEPILEAFARDVMPRVRALLEGRPGPG